MSRMALAGRAGLVASLAFSNIVQEALEEKDVRVVTLQALTPEQLVELAQGGKITPMQAIEELERRGMVVRDAPALNPKYAQVEREIEEALAPKSIYAALAREFGYWGPRITPPKPKPQQVFYRGSEGRAKVTFAGGEAMVSRLKPNGAWKLVGTYPWPPMDDFRVNAKLQEICGHEFYQEDV